MNIQEVIEAVGEYSLAFALISTSFPLVAWIIGKLHQEEAAPSWVRWAYSGLIYGVCLPGVLAVVLTAYSLFFLNANLLRVNILVYFLPIGIMCLTLFIIRKRISFDEIPGFGRIQGLMILIGLCFAIAIAIQKSRIVFGFFTGFRGLLILAALIWLAFKLGSRLLQGKQK